MKNIIIYISLLACLLLSSGLTAQQKSLQELPWKTVATGMPDEWYGSEESIRVAESVLLYQRSSGGWPKSPPMHNPLTDEIRAKLKREYTQPTGSTFDNSITISQMKFLARMYNKTKDPQYRSAFEKALSFMFSAQYDNGGWPQYYPIKKNDYSRYITYNDGAMVQIMEILDMIVKRDRLFSFIISDELVARAQKAFNKGIDCYLKTQIVIDGKPTLWCAQHDEITLMPTGARSYELPSISGGESAGILLQMMKIESPSTEVVYAIRSGVEWIKAHQIEGLRVEDFTNSYGKHDRCAVKDPNAPPLWGRFYDLETQQVFMCDFDGAKIHSMNDLNHDRRRGYRWYSTGPQKVLDRYPDWMAKHRKLINSFK